MQNKSFLYIFIFMLVGFLACENSLEDVQAVTQQFEEAVETVKDVQILYSESANVKVKLTAPLLLRHKTKDPYSEFPDGISVQFFDEMLQETGSLNADYGVRHERKQQTIVRENVVWVSATEQKRIESEELIWDERNKKIRSDKFVKVTTETESIFGTGFEAEQDFSRYTILNITGILKVNSDEFLKEK
ncbi:MAG: LPS export ABC transporter periplasmic protein LptC [Chitinophagales bacterium]